MTAPTSEGRWPIGFPARAAAVGLRLLRKAGRRAQPDLRELAAERVEICPAEDGEAPPPVTLPGQLERARASWFDPLEDIVEWATSTRAHHAATVLYRVEDVVYDRGHLFKGLVAHHVSNLGLPSGAPARTVDAMCLCSSASGSTFFGDWALADAPLELLARERGLAPLKILPHTRYPHLAALGEAMGLSAPYAEGVVRVRNLWIVDDHGYNDGKRRRLRELRARVRARATPRKPGGLVYLGRGTGSTAKGRSLSNEREVVACLQRLGFRCVDPGAATAEEILAETLEAAVVVGVEGSQLAYGFLALAAGGLMLALQPPQGFQSALRPRCVAAGLQWGFLVGLPTQEGFRIPPEDLEQVLAPYLRT